MNAEQVFCSLLDSNYSLPPQPRRGTVFLSSFVLFISLSSHHSCFLYNLGGLYSYCKIWRLPYFGIQFMFYNCIRLKNWSYLGLDLIAYLFWFFGALETRAWSTGDSGMQKKKRFTSFPQLWHSSSFYELHKSHCFSLICQNCSLF